MEKKSLNKILIISLIFIIIFSTTQYYRTQQGLPLKGDLEKHLGMAKTGTTNTYPPIFSWISKPFSFYKTNYYYFTITLLILIFPLTMFYFLHDWRTILFYFSFGFVWRMDLYGSMPMALGGLTFFIFLIKKNWKTRLILLITSPLIHSMLFFLLLGSWLIIELYKNPKLRVLGLFCNYTPTTIEKITPNKLLNTPTYSPGNLFNLGEITRFFTIDFPLPFIFLTIKGLWTQKDLILIGIFIFISGFIVYQRSEYMLCIIGIIGCTYGIKKLPKTLTKLVYLTCTIFITLNLIHWIFESINLCILSFA